MEYLNYLLLLILILVGYVAYKIFYSKEDVWAKSEIPVVPIDGLLSRLLWKSTSTIEFEGDTYKRMGDLPYAVYTEGLSKTLFVKDIEVIRKIFVKDFEFFVNRRAIKSEDVNFCKMLFNKANQEWKDLRSTMTPTFTTGKIRKMFPIFSNTSKKLVDYLTNKILKDQPDGGEVDMDDILGRYSLDVISSAAFGMESEIFKNPDSILLHMAKKLPVKFTFGMIAKFFITLILPFTANLFKFEFIDQEADEYFTNLLRNAIKYRESTGQKRNDFLQLMIDIKSGTLEVDDSSKDSKDMDSYEKDAQLPTVKNKIPIDEKTVIANCILFLLAGFDSITAVINFSTYALALNPQIQEKLRLELEKVTEESGANLTYDDINKHEYLDKVINESLRMYPPTSSTERQCTKDYPLDGRSILPKDTIVNVSIYQIHHDETYFPNPEVFDPERFSPENKAKRSPYAFMPFGHGPRNCIANRFALTEAKTVLASLVMNFEIEPCAKSPIPLKFLNTFNSLKPKGGMWLKLRPRK